MGLPGEGVVVTVTAVTAVTAVPPGLLIGRYAGDTATPVGLTWWTDESRRDGTNPAGPAGSARARQNAPARPTSLPPVPLQAISGHAPQARWQAMAAAAGDVVALGGARGGAHGNVRWTVWRGSTAGLVEQPQPFETFGGQQAVSMSGIGVPAGAAPLLVGTWEGAGGRGNDIALWHPEGARWVREEPTRPALAGTPTVLPTPEGVATSGAAVVIAGWVTDLTDGVRNRPVAWLLVGATARAVPLPFASLERSGGPGPAAERAQVDGQALAVGCNTAACLLVGRVGARPAAWWLDLGGAVGVLGGGVGPLSGGVGAPAAGSGLATGPTPALSTGLATGLATNISPGARAPIVLPGLATDRGPVAAAVAGADTAYALVPGDGTSGSALWQVNRRSAAVVGRFPGAPVALAIGGDADRDGDDVVVATDGSGAGVWRAARPRPADIAGPAAPP